MQRCRSRQGRAAVCVHRFVIEKSCGYCYHETNMEGQDVKKSLPALFITLIAMLVILSGCSPSQADTQDMVTSSPQELPSYVKRFSSEIQQTYLLAAEHAETLSYMPCYCGCYESHGHVSNLDCFIQEVKPTREVVWDPMGAT
ncbi:MAG: hypothetical protein BAA01_15090 [Bacillus thermozeamaize]|uniref:Uncharacterized protein n=1 Tax=Bacillus thermozeamaize TaxID=230954 RepID=A0A1Y3PFH8_9BACI|nr:MAG: hypothetical protein BAA01_15090 [Bacillus thermozeamaize]